MKSKMVALFAIIMVALMVAGFAYAHWSEILTIDGTVDTGKLDAKWTVGAGSDDEPDAKDVSSISGEVSTDGYTITVTVTNAYPCIHYKLPIDLHNIGTIPLHIYKINIDKGDLPCGTVEIILDPAHPDDPVIKECTQLHKDDAAYGLLHVHLCEKTGELQKYTFTVTVTVVQWNWPFTGP